MKSEIEVVLSKLQSLLDDPDFANGGQQETARYIYYQTLVLRRFQPEQQSQAFDYFNQLQSLNVSSPWKLAATTEVAKFFEDVEDSRVTAEPILRQQMTDVYQALQSSLASTASTNRDAVEVKLTKLYLADGKIEAASDIATDAPENASWLPTLAALSEAKGDLSRSERLWQRLEQLLPPASNGWWEARLNRLMVLRQLDADKAKAMLERTISLYPNASQSSEASQSVSARLQELARQWRAQ